MRRCDRLPPAAILLLGFALALWPLQAWADDPEPIREISTPNAGARLLGIATAPDGTLWFTDDGADQIGHYDPQTGQFRGYPVKTPGGEEWGILQDSKGRVWYTSWFREELRGLLGRLDPLTGEIREYELPGERPWAFSILEYQGGLWLPLISGNAVARFDPERETFHSYPLPPGDSHGPAYVIPAPEGDLWVSLAYSGALARLDPASGRYRILHPGPLQSPVGLLWDREGKLWIGDHGASRIARYDPGSGQLELFPTSQSFGYPLALPNELAQDSRGRIWFIQHGANRMAYYLPDQGVLVEIPIPTKEVNAQWMTLDGAERPWFAEYTTGMLGTVDPAVRPDLEIQPAEGSIRIPARPGEEARLAVRGSCGPGVRQVVLTSSTSYNDTGAYGLGLQGAFEPNLFEGCPGQFESTFVLRTEPEVRPGHYRVRLGASDGWLVLSRYVELEIEAGPMERLRLSALRLIEAQPLLLPLAAFLVSLVALLLAFAWPGRRRSGAERG